MQKQILQELKELKTLFTKLVGTTDLPESEQFSEEAVKKAAIQFQKMEAERGEWVEENDISKYIRSADWRAGKFIQQEFDFRAVIKKSHRFLYNRKALQSLATELKKRNIDLGRYMDYKRDVADFEKKLAAEKKSRRGKRPYALPSGLENITTSDIPQPPVELIRQDLENLKAEFFENKMGEYVDIYRGNHAMLKSIYWFEKYIDPGVKKSCSKWCDNFNYANHALTLVTRKKEKFTPVKEEDMISL